MTALPVSFQIMSDTMAIAAPLVHILPIIPAEMANIRRFLASWSATTPVRHAEIESTNSMAHSPTPPSDAPIAVTIPSATSALAPSEPALSESVVNGSPVKGCAKHLRPFATVRSPSRKILSRSSTANPPITITTGSDAPPTLADLPRLVFSYMWLKSHD